MAYYFARCLRDILSMVLPVNPHLQRVCDVAWIPSFEEATLPNLRKKLRFVLRHCGLRTISRAYERGVFSRDRALVFLVGTVLLERGLADAYCVRALMQEFREINGEFLHIVCLKRIHVFVFTTSRVPCRETNNNARRFAP